MLASLSLDFESMALRCVLTSYYDSEPAYGNASIVNVYIVIISTS